MHDNRACKRDERTEEHRGLVADVVSGEIAEFLSEGWFLSFFLFCTTSHRCTTNVSAYRIVSALLRKIWNHTVGAYLLL